MQSTSPTTPNARFIWLGISILIGALYFSILDAPFVYDDKIEVVGNRTIRFLEEWREILLYNPARVLLQLTYAANFHAAQFNPYPYHLTNVFIHILATAGALFASTTLARIDGLKHPLWFGGILTAWWALHPMAIEGVTYITGRSESLCAVFSFFAIGFKALHLETEQHRWNIAAWFAFLCGLMVKEVAVGIPLIFIALEWFQNQRVSKISWGLLLGGGLLFTGIRGFIVFRELNDPTVWAILSEFIPHEVDRDLHVQLLTQMEVWVRYCALWILPINQTIFHHIPDADLTDWDTWAFAVGWLGLILVLFRMHGLSLVAFCCIIIVLMPSSSFAALQENMAEHRSFQMGFFLGMWLLSQFWARWSTQRILPIAVPYIIILGWMTHTQNQSWVTEVRLWQDATLITPESPKAWYGLGDAHRFAKEFEPALAAFATCTRLDPSEMDCWNNLGITYAEMNNLEKAKETWLKALEEQPSYCKAHTNLGFMAYRQQEWDNALVEFRSTLTYCPTNVIAHYGLGLIYYSPRLDVQKAIHHFDQVLKIDPTFDYASDARQKLLDLTW